MDKETSLNVRYWIGELSKMKDNHCVDLDHKDCGDIAELLYELMFKVQDLEGSGRIG